MITRLLARMDDYTRESLDSFSVAKRWGSTPFNDKKNQAVWNARGKLFFSLAQDLYELQREPEAEMRKGVERIIKKMQQKNKKAPTHLYESIITELQWILE